MFFEKSSSSILRAGQGVLYQAFRLEAVRKAASRELAARRFKNYDSAERSIHDACTRRLKKLSAPAFDARVNRWLSGDAGELRSVLESIGAYAKDRAAAESLLSERIRLEHSVVSRKVTPAPPYSAEFIASDLIDAAYPERRETILQRLIRDTATTRAFKLRHHNHCRICGLAVPLWDGLTYAEAHHIRPLGHPHNGPDSPNNMLILCPNHHAQCDLGAMRLDLASLRQLPDHVIDTEHIHYHNTTIAK